MSKKGYWISIAVLTIVIVLLILCTPVQGGDLKAQTVTVHTGDTLYDYAHQYAPEMDYREYVSRVRELNKMKTGTIFAGQEIVILK